MGGRDLGKRRFNCNQCCTTENCNGQLCSDDHVLMSTEKYTDFTQPVTTMTTSDYHSETHTSCTDKTTLCNSGMCDDQHLAESLCPRTCGRCPTAPSTTATCLDHSTECQYVKEHLSICNNTDLI